MAKKIEEALEKIDETKLDDATVTEVETAPEPEAAEPTIADKVEESKFDAASDIEAIFSGMDLSKEFKEKAKSVYEASVIAQATQIAEGVAVEIEAAKEAEIAAITEQFEEDFEIAKANINEQIDDYLSIVTKDWLVENKVEGANVVRTELSESFMEGLADLLREHYVDIPDEKLDVVADLQEEIDKKSEEVSKLMEELVASKNEVETLVKEALVKEAAVGLTDLEADKLNRLAEAVDYTDKDTFAAKLTEIKEAYFKQAVTEEVKNTTIEDNEPVVISEEEEKTASKTSPSLDTTLRHLGRTSRLVPKRV